MFNEIKNILKENYEIDNVSLNSYFKTDFGLTSFDFLNLICIFEEKFNIKIDEAEFSKLETIEDLVNYLSQKTINK